MTFIRPIARRGFVLWEVLIALALLMIFFAATTHLLRASMQIPYRANQADALASRFDVALTTLRADVWGASAVTAEGADGHAIRIERADGPAVTWKIGDDGAFKRSSAQQQGQDWADVAKGLKFEVEGPLVLLVEPPDAHGDGRRIPLMRALHLSKQGGRP
jgi:type II secretory pathway component PulJ